jgi:hypothetical protein
VKLEELEALCREAARGVVEREDRPLPATIVLPLQARTRVVTLPDFPADEAGRHDLLQRFAAEVMRPANAPCYGFVAEGVARGDDGTPADVVVVAYSARRHHPQITAAHLLADGSVGRFAEAEPLAAGAMPFLAPLQQAAEAAEPPS